MVQTMIQICHLFRVFHKWGKSGFCESTDLPVRVWSQIYFSQYTEEENYFVKLLLNGKPIGNCSSIIKNTKPATFENVKAESQIFQTFILKKDNYYSSFPKTASSYPNCINFSCVYRDAVWVRVIKIASDQ